MNILPGRAARGGTVTLDHGGVVRADVALDAGRTVSVGIRPEHLAPCAAADAFLSGSVDVIEQLGADTLVHVAHGRESVIARLPQGTHPDAGTTMPLAADPARVYIFDAGTGARIR
jgi:ABC-type sugar transport system ATPase subunit